MNVHKGHRSRLREKVKAGGLATFSQHEVLELLLTFAIPRRDVNPLAHALTREFGSPHNVLHAPSEALLAVPGVGKKTADFLAAFCNVARALEDECVAERVRLQNPLESKAFLRGFFQHHVANVFWQFNLDLNGRLICSEAICPVEEPILQHTREISQSILECGAKTVIFACQVDRFSRVLREQMAVAMPYLYEYLQKIDVLLGESYAFVGNDAYSGLAFGREPARWQPRGAQYAAVFREHPRRGKQP